MVKKIAANLAIALSNEAAEKMEYAGRLFFSGEVQVVIECSAKRRWRNV
jgi:hypothetical protein